MSLRLTLLGTLRAWHADTEVDLGPPQQRAVLALLLVNANTTVRVRDIAKLLWSRPPRSAENVVHRYVGRLRRTLEPDLAARVPGRRLIRAAGGYRLAADADTLDLVRFRRLIGAADAAPGAEAVELYAEALGLWHGPAAGGIMPESQEHPAFAALDNELLAGLVRAADLACRVGRVERLAPVLHRVAAWHPLHEAVHARLIRALAVTNGQAAALDHYGTVRERLAAELGVLPGPELREAHDLVLRGEQTVVPAAPVPPASPPPPAQLPAALPVFAGRHAEIDRAVALAAPRVGAPSTVVISAIGGMAGIGKTTLAVHLAHLLADRFPDGQLYVNLRGFDPAGAVLSPADALRGFLDALGVPPHRIPEEPDMLAALYRTVLAGRRMLVVLDNARDAAHARPLLPGTSPGCLVLVTSRDRLAGLVAAEGAQSLMLNVLSPADCRESLVKRLGAARVAADPAAVDEIIELTAGLPLALAVVAAHATAHPAFPLSVLAAELRECAGSLDAYANTDPAVDARTVFSWSYRALGPGAARLFRLLALHPGPEISAASAAALAGSAPDAVGRLLAELSDAHLVIEQAPGRHIFHDLLRDYARELTDETDSEDERRAAVRRLLDHYLRHAYAAASVLGPPPAPIAVDVEVPDTGADAALEWFTAEWRALAAAVDLADREGFDTHAWQLAWTLERFHERHGHWYEWSLVQETALRAARRSPDRAAVAHALRGVGRAYSLLRRYDDALDLLRQAIDRYAEIGDATGEAYSRYCIGWIRSRQGRDALGVDEVEAALRLYQQAGHRLGQAESLNNMAWQRVQLGEFEAGRVLSRQSIALYGQLGDDIGMSRAFDTLAYAYHHLGLFDNAVESYENALRLFRAGGDRFNEGCTLDRLAESHHAAGDVETAGRTWQAALDLLDELDPPWADEVRVKMLGLASSER